MKMKTHYILWMNTKNMKIKNELKPTFNLIMSPIIDAQQHDINNVKIKIDLEYEFIDYEQTKILTKEAYKNDKSKK